MSTSTNTNVMQKVEQIATMAGYKVQQHPQMPDMIVCPFDMGNGRSQVVYLHPCGQSFEGQDVICFMSPCMSVKKGLLKGLSKKVASNLLQRNSCLKTGAFAIVNFDNIDLLVVRSTQIVDTMEVEEFRMHVNACAVIADEYEREHGTDVF